VIGASVVGQGVSLIGQQEAASEQEAAIRRQELANRVAANQQQLARNDKLRRIVSSQVARAGAMGITPDSGSFKAIQIDTFNQAAQDNEAANLNLEMKQDYLDQQEQNVENKAEFGMIGGLFNMGSFIASAYVPKAPSAPGGYNMFGEGGAAATGATAASGNALNPSNYNIANSPFATNILFPRFKRQSLFEEI